MIPDARKRERKGKKKKMRDAMPSTLGEKKAAEGRGGAMTTPPELGKIKKRKKKTLVVPIHRDSEGTIRAPLLIKGRHPPTSHKKKESTRGNS